MSNDLPFPHLPPEIVEPAVPYHFPKAEMHVHISLAMDEWTLLKCINSARSSLSSEFLWNDHLRHYTDLAQFHERYEALRPSVKHPEDIAVVVQSYLERIARDGCLYAEISFSFRDPRRMEPELEALSNAIEAAHYNTGIEARAVVTSLRNNGPEFAEQAAQYMADRKPKYVTAFGLVGDESIDSLLGYKRAMEIAWNDAGLGLVPHVAEQNIQNAVDFLEITPKEALDVKEDDRRRLRVGHGTLIHTSTDLMKRYRDKNVCLEVCLSANKRIGLPRATKELVRGQTITSAGGAIRVTIDRPVANYFNNLSAHPLSYFKDIGLRCCLGSDNPLLMQTSIGKEFSLARVRQGFTEDDLFNLTYTSIENANIDYYLRRQMRRKVDLYKLQKAAGLEISTTALDYKRATTRIPF